MKNPGIMNSIQWATILDGVGAKFQSTLGDSWTANIGRDDDGGLLSGATVWNGKNTYYISCNKPVCTLSKVVFTHDKTFGMPFIWGCSYQNRNPETPEFDAIGSISFGDAHIQSSFADVLSDISNAFEALTPDVSQSVVPDSSDGCVRDTCHDGVDNDQMTDSQDEDKLSEKSDAIDAQIQADVIGNDSVDSSIDAFESTGDTDISSNDIKSETSYDISTDVTLPSTPCVEWEKFISNKSINAAWSVKQLQDGNYIAAGQTGDSASGDTVDAWLIKTDQLGNKLWDKTYGGLHEDVAFSVSPTKDGGFIFSGRTYVGNVGDMDFFLVKTDDMGNEQWEKTFGGWATDEAMGVQQTADGGFMMVGFSTSFNQTTNAWIVKTDAQGNKVWDSLFGGTVDLAAQAWGGQQTADLGYALAGYIKQKSSPLEDVLLVKTDQLGQMKWSKTIVFAPDTQTTALAMQQTADGGYILAGALIFYPSQNFDAFILKTNTNGDVEWKTPLTNSGYNDARFVTQTASGGYIVGGYKDEPAYHTWVSGISPKGSELWSKDIGKTSGAGMFSGQLTNDNGFIMTGVTNPSPGAAPLTKICLPN